MKQQGGQNNEKEITCSVMIVFVPAVGQPWLNGLTVMIHCKDQWFDP